MTSFYEETFDPRQPRDLSRTTGPWVVGTDADSEQPSGITSELVGLSQRVDQLCQRPIKWTTQIRDLGDPALRLMQPLQILIEEYESEETVLARFPELELFGEAETEPEAILALKEDIVRLYYDLDDSSPDELGPLPQSWLRVLRQIIYKE